MVGIEAILWVFPAPNKGWGRACPSAERPPPAQLTRPGVFSSVSVMPRAMRPIALILAAAAFLLTGGCNATHSVVLNEDGSGTMTLHLEVSKLLRDYVIGLAEVSGEPRAPRADALFDLAAIRKGFEAQPGITVRNVSVADPRSLDVDIAFASLMDLFAGRAGLQSANVVSLLQSGGLETLKIHLDRGNYRQIAVFFPMLEDPVLKSLGPQVDQKATENDYLEMVRFSIGDEAPALVKKSSIVVTIRPEGQIESQTGGTLSDGAVMFKIPLLRLLLLDTPLDFSMSFRTGEKKP
jgi:hypothetical protein